MLYASDFDTFISNVRILSYELRQRINTYIHAYIHTLFGLAG